MNEAQLREALAPKVARHLQARLRGHGMPSIEAEQVAHEVIAMVQAASMQAQLADVDQTEMDYGGGAA